MPSALCEHACIDPLTKACVSCPASRLTVLRWYVAHRGYTPPLLATRSPIITPTLPAS
jgi:hypothetical protein